MLGMYCLIHKRYQGDNEPTLWVCVHAHAHACAHVCVYECYVQEDEALVFVFTTSQKQLKIQEKSLEGQSQVLPAVTYAGWISGNFIFLLRIWGSEEGKKANLTDFLFPWAIWYPQTLSGTMWSINHLCEWWRDGASSLWLLSVSSEAKHMCGLLTDSSVWPRGFYSCSGLCWHSLPVSLPYSS